MKAAVFSVWVAMLGCSAGTAIETRDLAAAHCASLPTCPIAWMEASLANRVDPALCEADAAALYAELSLGDQAQARRCLHALERTCPFEWQQRSGFDWLLPECAVLRREGSAEAGTLCVSGAECAEGLACVRATSTCHSDERFCGEAVGDQVADLWIEGATGTVCTNLGCREAVYGEVAAAEGDPCGWVDGTVNVCARGLACSAAGVCRVPASEGEPCDDFYDCGRGLLCDRAECGRPTLGTHVGAPCISTFDTCDSRLGLACVGVGPDGAQCARATDEGDSCGWDVDLCGEGLWCAAAGTCDPIPARGALGASCRRGYECESGRCDVVALRCVAACVET